MFVFGRLQLSLQLLFGLSDVLVHLLSLLLLHLIQSFPARRELKLKRAWLGKMWSRLSLPVEDVKIVTNVQQRQKSVSRSLHYSLIVLWSFLQQFFRQAVLIVKMLRGLHNSWTRSPEGKGQCVKTSSCH